MERDPRKSCARPSSRRVELSGGAPIGFHVSWIAVRGAAPDVVRGRLNLRQTNDREYVPESDVTGVDLPSGWYLVFFNDPVPPELNEETLSGLSVDAEVMGFVVEEASMVSLARGYAGGKKQWEIIHDSNEGLEHVEVTGNPPSSYAAICDRLLGKLKAGKPRADYLFDIPAELSKALVGFRYDEDIEGVDGNAFVVLERT